MEQDLKERVQEQGAEWGAAKKIPEVKMYLVQARAWANVVNRLEARARENGYVTHRVKACLRPVFKKKVFTNLKIF